MNAPVAPLGRPLEVVDALLMDVARRIQLTPTKHAEAEGHYRAICQYVDRDGSPLHGKVVECYAGGSFATGTAIASRVSRDQHDLDVVVELDVEPDADPSRVLQDLFDAINGETGSRYHGKVKPNSRCVTVEYDDKTTVDLMPLARFNHEPPRAGNLFHYKREAKEAYHKQVNPWGFANHFNQSVKLDQTFYETFAGRRLLMEALAERAETQPLPVHAPLEEKSARTVALQLIKRARDIAYRRYTGRKPPSVVLASLALMAGPVNVRLVDEVIAVASYIRSSIVNETANRKTLRVFNPAYPVDEFTDRWPEDVEAQEFFAGELRKLVVRLHRLRNEDLGLSEIQDELKHLFGETAARYAVESYLDERRSEARKGRLRFGPSGKVAAATGAAVTSTSSKAAAKTGTFEGGGPLPE